VGRHRGAAAFFLFSFFSPLEMQYSVSEGARVPRKTAAGKEIHYSNFFLMINSNLRPPTSVQARQWGYIMHNTANSFWEQQNFLQVIDKRDPATKLLSVKIGPWRVELSPINQRVHLHAMIKVVHDGSVQLDIPKIQQVFVSLWPPPSDTIPPLRSVAVNVKWVPAQMEMIARYVSKQSE